MLTPAMVRGKLHELALNCQTPVSIIASLEAAQEWESHGILVTYLADKIQPGGPTLGGIPLTVDRGAVGVKFLNDSGEVIGELN